MAGLSESQVAEIAARHPEAFKPSLLKRYAPQITIAALILYSLYCWWFFAIGETLRRANWDIAGAYLADWVSWEARPDIEIEPDGAMLVEFPRFSPLGADPDPDWLETETATMTRTIGGAAQPSAPGVQEPSAAASQSRPATGFMGSGGALGASPQESGTGETKTVTQEVVTRAIAHFGTAGTITIEPKDVTVTRGGETLTVAIGPGETVSPQGTLPSWAGQKYDGGKIAVSFGFSGRAEINYDGVKVRRRFLGWENFLFDTHSPYWGKPMGEVWSLITSGERLDPSRSNLSLAWNNILYNAEWQHLDVWIKLLQTIVMAFVGTLFAAILAFPLSFLAARNITSNRFLNQFNKRLFDFVRSVDMFIWALFFTRAFGPGPLAGISAIFFTDTGTLGKLYSESLENIDDKQREGVKSVGASPMLVQRYGVLPQVLPVFASQALYFWESNTRSATIIGAVGAGGIGLKLWEAMRTNQDWENVFYMVLLILIVVFVFDNISNALRSRLMGTTR